MRPNGTQHLSNAVNESPHNRRYEYCATRVPEMLEKIVIPRRFIDTRFASGFLVIRITNSRDAGHTSHSALLVFGSVQGEPLQRKTPASLRGRLNLAEPIFRRPATSRSAGYYWRCR